MVACPPGDARREETPRRSESRTRLTGGRPRCRLPGGSGCGAPGSLWSKSVVARHAPPVVVGAEAIARVPSYVHEAPLRRKRKAHRNRHEMRVEPAS